MVYSREYEEYRIRGKILLLWKKYQDNVKDYQQRGKGRRESGATWTEGSNQTKKKKSFKEATMTPHNHGALKKTFMYLLANTEYYSQKPY